MWMNSYVQDTLIRERIADAQQRVLLVATWPDVWTSLFSADPAVHATAARYLGVVALTYPFLGLGFTLSYAFQAAGRPLWPLLAIVSGTLLVAAGGWIAVQSMDSGLGDVALVGACGLLLYGSTLAVAFRAGAWRPVRRTHGVRKLR
jgi:MATE family, multidrug efflux pump